MLARFLKTPRSQLVLILLVAFALRLINLTFQPLWFDEGWSVWFANSDLLTLTANTAKDIHPPLYYALLHFWIMLCGTDEFSLRYLSLWIGVVSVIVLYRFASEIFDPSTGKLTAMLMAVSPIHVYYAQEIRMYGLVTLLGLVSSWLFWRALHVAQTKDVGQQNPRTDADDERKRSVPATRYWLAYVLVASAIMYTQYYGAFIPLFHGLYWLFNLWRNAKLSNAKSSPFPLSPVSSALLPFLSFISILCLYTPWLIYVASQLTQYVADKVNIEQYTPLAPHDFLWRHLAAFSLGHLSADSLNLAWVALIFVALALCGMFIHDTQPTAAALRSRSLLFLLLYFFVPFLAAYLIQLRFPFAPPRMERLLLLASPPFGILIARGIQIANLQLEAVARRQSPSANSAIPAFRLSLWSLILSLLFFNLSALATFYTTSRYPEQDYRPIATRINALTQSSDLVVVVHPWQIGFLQAYLDAPHIISRTASDGWSDGKVRAQLNAALARQQRIWLPAYQTLGRVLENEMERHLSTNALTVEARWYEQTRLLFYAPMPTFNIQLTDKLPGRIELADAPREAGWGIIPLKLTLARTNDAQPSLNVSLRLKDAQGRMWAAQDRKFASFSAPAQQLSDSLGLLVPAGTPPDRYQLHLALYDANSQQIIVNETHLQDINVIPPVRPLPIAALPIQTPLIANWVDMRLLGFALRDGAWQAGESLHLDLFWQARADIPDARLLSVQLQDAQGNPIAIHETPPTYPTIQWRRADLVREQRALLIPATLPAGNYRLVVGWLTVPARNPLWLERGSAQVLLREIVVQARPHQFNPPALQSPLDIRFADHAKLVGYDLALNTQKLTLQLHWQAQREVESDYKVFVHVVPLNSNQPSAQHDSPPANGSLPTTSWVAREYIADEHVIALPPDMPKGAYRILVGLYNPKDNMRVRAFSATGAPFANDAAEITQIELR